MITARDVAKHVAVGIGVGVTTGIVAGAVTLNPATGFTTGLILGLGTTGYRIVNQIYEESMNPTSELIVKAPSSSRQPASINQCKPY